MSSLIILYGIRQLKGGVRQPQYGHHLQALALEIRNMRLDHPYRLIRDEREKLKNNKIFNPGGTGSTAIPSNPQFIYHLSSISKVAKHTTWTYLPTSFATKNHPDWKIFECIMHDYKKQNYRGWLALSNYAQGKYSGFRDFTWWTDLELRPHSIVCGGAHRIGLPNRWIPKYALVLRCSASCVMNNQLVCVPTTIDGFVSEIFIPADFRMLPYPLAGRTINLDSPGPLIDGENEYALKPIDVSEIEFYPILIEKKMRSHVVQLNTRLWQLLERYYNKL